MLISSLHASFNFLIRSPKKIPASTSAEIIHSGWNKIILNSKRRFPESISIAHPFFEWSRDPTNVLSERKYTKHIFRNLRGATRRFAQEGGWLFSSSSLGTMREQEAFCSNAVNPYYSPSLSLSHSSRNNIM